MRIELELSQREADILGDEVRTLTNARMMHPDRRNALLKLEAAIAKAQRAGPPRSTPTGRSSWGYP